jgi:hypothetical protein
MNDFDDDRVDGDPPPRRETHRARARTGAPGVFLIILGAFGILTSAAFLIFTHNLTPVRNWMKEVEAKQPPGELKDQIRESIEDLEQADTPEGRLVNTAIYGGTLFTSLLVTIAGFKMRSLTGYPLALVGAVLAIIPFNGCCCFTTPFGIWALVVLLNPDVKDGFGRAPRAVEDDFDGR